MNKILSIGGIGNSGNPPNPNTEIWSTQTNQCQDIPDMKHNHNGAVSGFVNGEPTVCGGYYPDTDTYSKDCYRYDRVSNDFVQVGNLYVAVAFAAHAPWQGGTESIITVGGQTDEGEILDGIQVHGKIEAWNRPELELTSSCMVHLFNDTYFLMGGRTNTEIYSDLSFLLKWIEQNSTFQVDSGPPLNCGRNRHMCGKIEDQDKKYIVVVGGQIQQGQIRTCEYLEFNESGSMNNEWKSCESFIFGIMPIKEGQAVSDPETGDLLFIGGIDQEDNVPKNTIYRLSIKNGQWKWSRESQGLQAERTLHTSLFVPDGKLPC